MRIAFSSINSNIGHFLHQELQYLLDFLLKDISVELLLPEYIKIDKRFQWHYGIFNVLQSKNTNFITVSEFENDENIHIIHPGSPQLINISYIKYLQKIVFEYYNVDIREKNDTYKVLYTRTGDTDRRHILNSESVKDQFDLIIDNLTLPFEDQIKLFSKVTHFVSVESGAHFVNIMFMKPNTRVMNILTRTDFSTIDNRKENYDSWQLRFGTYIFVNEFNVDYKAEARIPCSNGAASGDHDMHDHVLIDEKLKDNILTWLNKDETLTISHPGYHGFFSYCSVALEQIIKYVYHNKRFPKYVDMSKIFTRFKTDENLDISSYFFNHYHNEVKIGIIPEIPEEYLKDLQFSIYSTINYNCFNSIIKKYFTLSNEVKNIYNEMSNKYFVDYENTFCVFLRGNDKATETKIPGYEEYLSKINQVVKDKNFNGKFLLQSDESQFFDFFAQHLSSEKCVIFNDEIKHINKQKSSINHIFDTNTTLQLNKNFLAIVYIMSKCKYVICNSGNISLWITLFRGNCDGIYEFLNGEWY